MSDIAIKVENLSKLYQLGTVGTGTLKNDIRRWWANARGKEDPFSKIGQINDRTKKATSEFVWALKDIEFEVKKGEVLGIIGRNGAGKSTLLKILSKITSPTTGKIKIDGRIASLLEVGTGFHPELSGRDNIFMNGAILGMRKWEIQKKFDEIVDFSGVEAYIDTPVKRYSSGMYVRLAFAVAAFLEPEILIVDEVLAVGDVDFQKKCLGRMKDVSVNEGRTVLFVSHNMAAIKKMCSQGVLLANGILNKFGVIDDVLENYLTSNIILSANWIRKEISNSEIYFKEIGILNSKNVLTDNIAVDEDFYISVNLTSYINSSEATIVIRIDNTEGISIFTSCIHDANKDFTLKKGHFEYKAKISKNILMPGRYHITVACFISRIKLFDFVENAITISVEDLSEYNMDVDRSGFVKPIYKWEENEI